MRRAIIVFVSAGACVTSALSPVTLNASQLDALPHAVAIAHFHGNVARYMAIKRDATATVGAPRVSANCEALLARTQALAAAIRTLRPTARTGDIFTADTRTAFRSLIAQSMAAHGDTTARIMARAADDVIEPCEIRPSVHQTFPWQLGAMMPPYLLSALPPLPAGLQYRIVDRDLILLDLDANIVIDILKDALPPVD